MKRTNTGRVVYNRKKHEFSVKRLGNIVAVLYENEKGNMPEWRYIVKIATLAWGYWAHKEGRLSEFEVWMNGKNVCDPAIRQAYEFFKFLDWLFYEALEWVSAIPYVGEVADIAIAIFRVVYDPELTAKLGRMVRKCEEETAEMEEEEGEEELEPHERE
jgi:hypothetical protein